MMETNTPVPAKNPIFIPCPTLFKKALHPKCWPLSSFPPLRMSQGNANWHMQFIVKENETKKVCNEKVKNRTHFLNSFHMTTWMHEWLRLWAFQQWNQQFTLVFPSLMGEASDERLHRSWSADRGSPSWGAPAPMGPHPEVDLTGCWTSAARSSAD